MMTTTLSIFALVLLLSGIPAEVTAKSPPSRDIMKGPHNLSTSGGGGEHNIKSVTETRVCIFCHTPHHATPNQPLWSREISSLTIYIPYESSTIRSAPQQPRGPSRLCLSCHDGTIAMGLLAGGTNLDITLPPIPSDPDPKKNSNLGNDLSDDHPVSMTYLSGASSELNDPGTLASQGVRLNEGSYVECTTCHDPHNNANGNFLVRSVTTQHDALCTTCHAKNGWGDPDTAHRTGGGRYPTIQADVAAEGCMNCHRNHSAERPEHLLKLARKGDGEESTCLSACHHGAPYADIWSEFNARPYTHPIGYSGTSHKANERLPLLAGSRHVECADCHNPHQAGYAGTPLGAASPQVPPASRAPFVSGPLRGVRGVDLYGAAEVRPAQYEYEICYRCHSGGGAPNFVSSTYLPPLRVFVQYDESLRFLPSNPSFHPVAADRKGTGASLRTELQQTMFRIYCTDCHLPHGGNEPHMLRAQNWDTVPSPVTDYPLCFRCHDPEYLLNPLAVVHSTSATLHRSHVLGLHDTGSGNRASCSACHDPHGNAATAGASIINGLHLMNFDKRYAGPSPVYSSMDRSCTVACHSTNPRRY